MNKYNRILLKLSGESLMGSKKFGISSKKIEKKIVLKLSKDLKKVI